jgi:3-(3-hydroxy-phenyl)propionate hydroxylase
MNALAIAELRLSREHTVGIAGGGPTGLMLAGELALADVDVAIVEQRPPAASERISAMDGGSGAT